MGSHLGPNDYTRNWVENVFPQLQISSLSVPMSLNTTLLCKIERKTRSFKQLFSIEPRKVDWITLSCTIVQTKVGKQKLSLMNDRKDVLGHSYETQGWDHKVEWGKLTHKQIVRKVENFANFTKSSQLLLAQLTPLTVPSKIHRSIT